MSTVRAEALKTADDVERLYDEHAGVAYSLAFQLLRDQGAAEDVVQEAFLAAWRSRQKFDPTKGGLRSWLLTIVRNRAIDRLRHDRLRPEAPLELDLGEEVDPTCDPGVLGPERIWMRNALKSLPRAQRTAINLAYFGGFTQAQIADYTRQPIGTVKSQLRLGLLKLAQLDLARFGTMA
jgi:RNA polymerase sigma-70 factor (ECF subfamily)